MQYSFIAAAILALTTSVLGQTDGFVPITAPTKDQDVVAGASLDIVWQPTAARPGPITIELLQGATPATLEIGQTVAASIDQTTGKFTWTVPKDLKSFATYGFKITLDSTKTLPAAEQIFQFSFPFHITGLGASSSSAAASGYPTGGTTTVHLSTGTGYPAKPTTASSVSTYVASVPSAANITSTYAPATTSVTSYPTANVTLSTSAKPTASKPASGSASGTASTTAPVATVTGNSASTIARGGLAVAAGVVLAFAL